MGGDCTGHKHRWNVPLVAILAASLHTHLSSRPILLISPEFLFFCSSSPLRTWFDWSCLGPLEFIAVFQTTWKVSSFPLLLLLSPHYPSQSLPQLQPSLAPSDSFSSRGYSEGQQDVQQIRGVCWSRKCGGKVCFLGSCHLL